MISGKRKKKRFLFKIFSVLALLFHQRVRVLWPDCKNKYTFTSKKTSVKWLMVWYPIMLCLHGKSILDDVFCFVRTSKLHKQMWNVWLWKRLGTFCMAWISDMKSLLSVTHTRVYVCMFVNLCCIYSMWLYACIMCVCIHCRDRSFEEQPAGWRLQWINV